MRIISKVLKVMFLTPILFSVLFVLVYFFAAKQVGTIQARYDIWKGRYEIHGYGFPIGGCPIDINFLKKHGIEYRHVAGCVVDDFIIKSTRSYNLIMNKAIKKDLGIELSQLSKETDETPDNKSISPLILLKTPSPKDPANAQYQLSGCSERLATDLDGDLNLENLCFKYLHYKEPTDDYTFISLVIDVFQNKRLILSQEIDRKWFVEETLISVIDIDSDGKSELITEVSLSPDCSNCSFYRVYEFDNNRFVFLLNIMKNIPLNHSSLSHIIKKGPEFEKIIQTDFQEKTQSEYPCGIYENCVKSEPWVVDLDNDGELEVVMLASLASSPYDLELSVNNKQFVFIAKVDRHGHLVNYKLSSIDLECCEGFADILGILTTNDNRLHFFINSSCPGTSIAYPILNIFDIRWNDVKKIGEFSGFYEHDIPERFKDIDKDGNTEIIFVKDTYWPSGAPHFKTIPIYNIAQYRKGRYEEASHEFAHVLNQLNRN